MARYFLVVFSILISGQCLAGGSIEFVNWYATFLHALGMHDHHAVHEWMAVCSSGLVLLFLTLVGLKFRIHINNLGDNIIPSRSFGFMTFVEMIMEFIYSLVQGVIGEGQFKKYMPLMSTIFLFIFFCNLSGMIPGFPPATENFSSNLAMGFTIFLVYNFAGIKEHGFAYIKQFTGPILLLVPLMFIIETVGHIARPLSLSLRLMGNIFGDHLVFGVLASFPVIGWVFPGLFLFFGLLVASIQSLVFTLLSSIYVSMAVSHDH